MKFKFILILTSIFYLLLGCKKEDKKEDPMFGKYNGNWQFHYITSSWGYGSQPPDTADYAGVIIESYSDQTKLTINYCPKIAYEFNLKTDGTFSRRGWWGNFPDDTHISFQFDSQAYDPSALGGGGKTFVTGHRR